MRPSEWQVGPGDTLETIAYECGVSPARLWGDERNAELRSLKLEPAQLQEGDVLRIPELRPKHEPAAPGTLVRCRRKHAPAWLSIIMTIDGAPRKQVSCACVVDGVLYRLATDDNGIVDIPIPVASKQGQLMVFYGETTPDVELDLTQRRTEVELEVDKTILRVVAEIAYERPDRGKE